MYLLYRRNNKMTDKTVVVVGGGASAVAFVASVLEGMTERRAGPRLTVYIIEKRPGCGRGLAYSRDFDSNILNTRAGSITLFPNKPGHFYQWLIRNRELWEDDFPGLVLNQEAFVPRSLFGIYLEDVMCGLTKKAIEVGCKLISVQGEAKSINYGHDGRIVVATDTSIAFQCDHVVLSCGNLGTKEYGEFSDNKNFFRSPYPVKRLAHRIDGDARVGILGSRLSAIDAIIALTDCGHRGPIAVHSRSGFLPTVRGTQTRYQPTILTRERIESHIAQHGYVRLEEFIAWTRQEMTAAGEVGADLDLGSLQPPTDIAKFLANEIEVAAHPRIWQAVLYSTNNVIDLVWSAMPDADRAQFWPHISAWMAYRVSIPVENARKLLALVRSGQLTFVTGGTRIRQSPDGLMIETERYEARDVHHYGAIIVATGTPRDAGQLDSDLIENILAHGLGRAHPYGGLVVDPDSGCLINSAGREDSRITVLGELTSGTFFFTSVLEINARHAQNRAAIVLRKLEVPHAREPSKGALRLSA
jgi:uncharacterized NAD(P)/FAD-binding protein YdhS